MWVNKRIIFLVLILFVVVQLSGCGLKDDLYLPEEIDKAQGGADIDGTL
jgi:predicted small lipoprotein YifL